MSTHKYQARKCEEDGFKFDSMLERDTYLQLKRLHDAGDIRQIELQRKFELYSRTGVLVGKYIADFYCILNNGMDVVVEAKGVCTPIWQRTKRHFLADYSHIPLIVVHNRNAFPLILEDLMPPPPTEKKTTKKKKLAAGRKSGR